MKKFTLIFLVAVLSVGLAFGQSINVTGTVKGDDGNPLPGVAVTIKGSSIGTVTDKAGKYAISAPATGTLNFSYIGMIAQSAPISSRNKIDVTMATDSQSLEEVVVTAMGIKRSEKSLGYSVEVVGSEELEKARSANVVNSLAGQVAGVNIIQNSGTAGGSSKIILRGQSSMGSSGQPLFIVDGLPISNQSFNFGITGAVDTGSRIGDISPDDIASMSVLKGAAATALYGARAKDGAIIITTKRGNSRQKTVVSVNSSYRIDNVLALPDYQNVYATGNAKTASYDLNTWNGWGPKIDGLGKIDVFTGKNVDAKAYDNNVRDFFQTGFTADNNVSIEGGDEKNDFRLSLSALNQKGIIEKNTYDRYNFTFNGGRKFSEKFDARVAFTYVRSNSEGRPAQGSNDQNVVMPTILGMPRNIDSQWLKDNWSKKNVQGFDVPYTIYGKGAGATANPLWQLNKNQYTGTLDRIMGSFILTWKPIENLTISNNFGTDVFFDKSRRVWAKYTPGMDKGKFSTVDWTNSVINNDFIATYNIPICDDWNIKVIGGHNTYQSTNQYNTIEARDLLMPEVYSFANASVTNPVNFYSRNRLVGVYGDVGVSYKDIAFLNVTGRNDWSSTMPKSHRSYFYPSVSGSFVFSELIKENKILSYGKLRASYASVGSDTSPYQLDYVYSPLSTYFLQYVPMGTYPFGGNPAYGAPRVFPDSNLEPQMQKSFEVGVDLRLFQGRVNIDATYYNTKTSKQIAAYDTPLSTGYFAARKNGGTIKNEGVELMLGVTPVRNKNFNWNVTFNFATNKQSVVSISDGLNLLSLTSGWSGLQIMAAPGEPFSIYGTGWARDDKGNIIINQSNGARSVTGQSINLGKIDPDFTLGIVNNLSYKGINLGFVIDWRDGGVMYSSTNSMLQTSGLGKETLFNNREPIVDKGVWFNGTEYVPNEKSIKASDYWSKNFVVANTEANIYDASYVKLRQLTLSYDLPKKWFKNFFIKDIAVGFEGRNLWIIHCNVPNIDPELNFLSSNDIGAGVEFASIPSTRSFGFNLKFKF